VGEILVSNPKAKLNLNSSFTFNCNASVAQYPIELEGGKKHTGFEEEHE